MFLIQFFEVPGYEFGNANSKIKKICEKNQKPPKCNGSCCMN